jgi:hypothetical protein
MTVAIAGAKNAVIDELEELVTLSESTRQALEKLNIRDIICLIKDVRKANDTTEHN